MLHPLPYLPPGMQVTCTPGAMHKGTQALVREPVAAAGVHGAQFAAGGQSGECPVREAVAAADIDGTQIGTVPCKAGDACIRQALAA